MDIASQFNVARQRILAGEQLTIQEQKDLIAALRGARYGAAETSAASKTKKIAKAGPSDEDLSNEFASLGL